MRHLKAKIVSTLAASTALVGGIGLQVPAAHADPVFVNAYNGVGSDTIQYVVDALSGAPVNGKFYTPVSFTSGGATKVLSSWDAVPPGFVGSPAQPTPSPNTITTKIGGSAFDRPNGSGQGQAALSHAIDAANPTWESNNNTATSSCVSVKGQIDFARSSAGVNKSAPTGTQLTFVPFARDAVSYAYIDSTGALANLSDVQLQQIYSGSLTTLGGVTLHPYLPQSGSGTRSFFEGAIGVTDGVAGVTVGTNIVEENSADSLQSAPQGSIVPFSSASWVAQNNGVAPNQSVIGITAGVKFGQIDDTQSISGRTGTDNNQPAFTGSGSSLVPNPNFYNDPFFGRDTYLVVPTSKVSGFPDPAFTALVGTQMQTAASTATISAFGFVNESYDGDVLPTQSSHVLRSGLTDNLGTNATGCS
jgi:ABC-type phosphate transport system substrate-binding protein